MLTFVEKEFVSLTSLLESSCVRVRYRKKVGLSLRSKSNDTPSQNTFYDLTHSFFNNHIHHKLSSAILSTEGPRTRQRYLTHRQLGNQKEEKKKCPRE